MSRGYNGVTSTNTCEYCGEQYVTPNSRDRLCPACQSGKADIKAVLGERSYGSASSADKAAIAERVSKNRTTRSSKDWPNFGRQYYLDKGLELPDAYK